MTSQHATTALLVESNEGDLESLRQSFAELDFELIEARSIADAFRSIECVRPTLVLSELRLPDGSGFSLCRQLRERLRDAATPILLTSRWCAEADRILAFECGADDFIAKPFYPRELTSRIRAMMRRVDYTSPTPAGNDIDPTARLRLDPVTKTVFVSGREAALTPHEFSVLVVLGDRPGHALSRAELIKNAWEGDARPSARSVDTHVKSLRAKLGAIGDAIETVRGVGYRLRDDVALDRRID